MQIVFTFSLILPLFQGCMLARLPATGTSRRPTPRQPRQTLSSSPLNEYESYTSISDLVHNRPSEAQRLATKKYMKAFKKHPQVQAIDLHQIEKGTLAQQLFNLRDPQQTAKWQKKMTLTTKMLLKDEKVDEETVKGVLGYNFAQRTRKADERRRKKEKDTVPDFKHLRSKENMEYFQQNRNKIYDARRNRRLFIKELSGLVKSRAGEGQQISATEVANIAEEMKPRYPQMNTFRPALRTYFRKNGYSGEDVAMALGIQSMLREKEKVGHSKGKKQASTSIASSSKVGQESSENHDMTAQSQVPSSDPESPLSLPTVKQKDDVDKLEAGPWWEGEYSDKL
jgi:hypothetical protein